MADIEFHYNGKQYFGTIPLREIQVDYERDNNPQRPVPSHHEILIKNNTANRLKEFVIDTNLPKGTFEIDNIPYAIEPFKSSPIRLTIFGRRVFESKLPDELQLNVIYKEVMKRG